MFTLIMHLISENPWIGPVLFGVVCDIITTIFIGYAILESRFGDGK